MIGKAVDSSIRKANEMAATFGRYAAYPTTVEPVPPRKSNKEYRRSGLMPDLARYQDMEPRTRHRAAATPDFGAHI